MGKTGNPNMCNQKHWLVGDGKYCQNCGHLRDADCHMKTKERPDWREYFINIAEQVAKRATCPRAWVGAVIVKDNRIISTGYNGAPAGESHCTEQGCFIEHDHCIRAIHAETNAVTQAAKYGVAIDGALLYFWDSQSRRADSCNKCFQVMQAAGIAGVIDRDGAYMPVIGLNPKMLK
jgi:dCMP deaminase